MDLPCGRGCWLVTGLLARREGSVPKMTFECALAISIRPLLGGRSGTGACVSLASLSVQARVVLVVPAQPHGAGASPGEAVASPKP